MSTLETPRKIGDLNSERLMEPRLPVSPGVTGSECPRNSAGWVAHNGETHGLLSTHSDKPFRRVLVSASGETIAETNTQKMIGEAR